MEISYDALRRIQIHERENPKLGEISENFYSIVGQYLLELQRDLKEDFSLKKAKEYENILKIVRDIRKRRNEKIVLLALRNFRSSQESGIKNMLEEETRTYRKILEILSENEEKFEGILNGKVEIPLPAKKTEERKTEEKAGEKEAERIKRIRFLKNIPKFIGFDNNYYGPFKAGDETILPEKIADVLIKRRLGELKQ